MKLPVNAIKEMVHDLEATSKSLQLNLCGNLATSSLSHRQSIVQSIEDDLLELFSSPRNFLTEQIFNFHSPSSHTIWNTHRNNNELSDEVNAQCHAAFTSHLKFKSSMEFEYLYVDGLDTAFLHSAHHQCFTRLIAFLSNRHEICHLSPVGQVHLKNFEAQWIVQSGVDGSRPFYAADITGENQVVACSDTGLDKNNCYFRDAAGEVATTNYVSYSRSGAQNTDLNKRKIVQYNAFIDATDEENGHGTHVVGSIVGHKSIAGTTDGESTGFADGVAKDAKVAFFDVGSTSSGGLMTPGDISSLFNPGRVDAGANFHSASWGSSSNAYGVSEYNYDLYTHTNDDFLILVAAGNDGSKYLCVEPAGQEVNFAIGGTYGCVDINNNGIYLVEDVYTSNNIQHTTGSAANAKNIISVGASESANGDLSNEQNGMEYLASFSSRGPTADGRIKPDMVAPGYSILSASAKTSQSGECDPGGSKPTGGSGTFAGISFMQGTSMATPVSE